MTSPAPALPTSVVLYAKDPARVAAFYRQALQLTSAEEGDGFAVLVAPGIELSLVRIPPGIAADIVIAEPPVIREDTPVKASFAVDSLVRVRAAIAGTGGGLREEESAWRWRGALHLDGWDPEGNVVQFRQAEA